MIDLKQYSTPFSVAERQDQIEALFTPITDSALEFELQLVQADLTDDPELVYMANKTLRIKQLKQVLERLSHCAQPSSAKIDVYPSQHPAQPNIQALIKEGVSQHQHLAEAQLDGYKFATCLVLEQLIGLPCFEILDFENPLSVLRRSNTSPVATYRRVSRISQTIIPTVLPNTQLELFYGPDEMSPFRMFVTMKP